MLVDVIAVTAPSALTEVVISPPEPDDAEAMAIDVALPLVEVAVTTEFDEVPFAPFAPEVEVAGVPEPPGVDVPTMSVGTSCLISRRTSPRQSIVTLSPREKWPDKITLVIGTTHVSRPTLRREEPSLVISPVVARGVACGPCPAAATAELAIRMPTAATAMSVMNERMRVDRRTTTCPCARTPGSGLDVGSGWRHSACRAPRRLIGTRARLQASRAPATLGASLSATASDAPRQLARSGRPLVERLTGDPARAPGQRPFCASAASLCIAFRASDERPASRVNHTDVSRDYEDGCT